MTASPRADPANTRSERALGQTSIMCKQFQQNIKICASRCASADFLLLEQYYEASVKPNILTASLLQRSLTTLQSSAVVPPKTSALHRSAYKCRHQRSDTSFFGNATVLSGHTGRSARVPAGSNLAAFPPVIPVNHICFLLRCF